MTANLLSSSVHAEAIRWFDAWREAAAPEAALPDHDRLVETAR